MTAMVVLSIVSLAVWFVLLLARGFFWLPRLPIAAPTPARWPTVVAVVPARDEATAIEQSIGSLLRQNYPGAFSIVLVDDHSGDGTAEIARRMAEADRLRIVSAPPLPHGWTGKLSAMNRGVQEAGAADLILFTDADIEHHPTNLRELVARLETEKRDLVLLMVELHCETVPERLLIPAFVFFFAMLYPFAWVGDPRAKTAAAAGGCMLIRRQALERIGGLIAIKGDLIDDCALARAVKTGGAIRLDLTRRAISIRPYRSITEIWNMIARGAYTQLRYSPALLAVTIAAMAVTYVAPLLLWLFGRDGAAWLGGVGWLLMALAYLPMVRFYRLSPAWSLFLPVAALIYLGATVASAWRHFRGRGGSWKGRVEWRSVR